MASSSENSEFPLEKRIGKNTQLKAPDEESSCVFNSKVLAESRLIIITFTLARTMIALGLGVATVAFAGRYAFRIWKPLEQAITEAAKRISTSSLSSYYKGGFEQKMSRREASLILGVSPSAGKDKIRTAHRKIMILNHPDKADCHSNNALNVLKIPINASTLSHREDRQEPVQIQSTYMRYLLRIRGNCSDEEENGSFLFARFRNPEKQSMRGKESGFLNSNACSTWQAKDKGTDKALNRYSLHSTAGIYSAFGPEHVAVHKPGKMNVSDSQTLNSEDHGSQSILHKGLRTETPELGVLRSQVDARREIGPKAPIMKSHRSEKETKVLENEEDQFDDDSFGAAQYKCNHPVWQRDKPQLLAFPAGNVSLELMGMERPPGPFPDPLKHPGVTASVSAVPNHTPVLQKCQLQGQRTSLGEPKEEAGFDVTVDSTAVALIGNTPKILMKLNTNMLIKCRHPLVTVAPWQSALVVTCHIPSATRAPLRSYKHPAAIEDYHSLPLALYTTLSYAPRTKHAAASP
ncbi:hypothetical protein IHE44_0005348 [Lamprotornis superbus]|uniref:Uncharacterized protein n=1 Tax=Lamprotornis superbus TaxID=245042 RepID=A0A835TRC6_9PASS|nr:hypothetical protein IHE44_0005348 [Lamprotornis superbus]